MTVKQVGFNLEESERIAGDENKTVYFILNSKKAKDTRTFGQDILLGTHIIRNVSKFFFTPPPKNSIQADEASIVIAGSIHETQFNKPRYASWSLFDADDVIFSGGSAGGENQSAVLVPIDEAEKKGEGEEGEEEEGPEEVALDWWSKYFASKENQCEHGNKDGDCDAKGHSDEEEGAAEDAGNEGKPRFK